MKNLAPSIALINENVEKAKEKRIAQLSVQDAQLNGKTILIEGREYLNFGSCSYLGLELDERLKEAAIAAIQSYGAQFSCSRSYLSLHLYDELESLLSEIFGQPSILAPSTSLAHISNIPVLVNHKDAVVLDHQVHASVQNAVKIAKAGGTHVEMMRHNNMMYLESRLRKLCNEYDKVWYMADGIYSMFGDVAPMEELYQLLDRFDNFYLYIDDAHGMSWTGQHGSGYVLSKQPFHEKMILTASLAKGFGSCGGVMVYPNKELRDLVRNCGGTMMFSGPLQPGVLGASIASAKIHLSPELASMQQELKNRISYFINRANELDLPLVKQEETPIFFVGVGNVDVGYQVCKQVMNEGAYLNIAAFPSVPYNNTGLRMTLSRHHSIADIDRLLSTISFVLDQNLAKAKYSRADIFKSFKMVPTKKPSLVAV